MTSLPEITETSTVRVVMLLIQELITSKTCIWYRGYKHRISFELISVAEYMLTISTNEIKLIILYLTSLIVCNILLV